MSTNAAVTISYKDRVTKGLKRSTKAMQGFKSGILGVARSITSVRGLMIGLGGALGAFRLSDSFIDANSSLEKMKIQLEGMLGTAEKGEEAFAWIKQFQLENPIADLQNMTKQFTSLVSAGIDPTTGAMEGLLGAMAKYSLTADDINGVTRALRQSTALTNAQKQELNQMVERIPQVTKLIATEMEMTQEELLKGITSMQVDSIEMARATLRALQKDGAHMIKKMEGTWQAGINRLKTAWFDLMTTLGDTGLFDKIKRKVDQLTAFLQNNLDTIVDFTNKIIVVVSDMFNQFQKAGTTAFGEGGWLKGALKGVDHVMTAVAQLAVTLSTAMGNINISFSSFEKRAFLVKENLAFLTGKKGPTEKLAEALERQQDIRGRMIMDGSSRKFFNQNEETEEFKAVSAKVNQLRAQLKLIRSFFTEQDTHDENLKKWADSMKSLSDGRSGRSGILDDMFKGMNFTFKPSTAGKLEKGLFPELANIQKSATEGVKKGFVDGMTEGIEEVTKKYDEKYKEMAQMGKEFAMTTSKAMANSMDEFFFDALEGNLKKASDYFNSFFKSIAKSIAQVANQKIVNGLISGVLQQVVNYQQPGDIPAIDYGANYGPQNSPAPFVNGGALSKAGAPIQVNIVNEAGEPVRAKASTASQSTSGMVLGIVLEGLSRNEGGSRDAMRAMVR